MSPHNTFNHDSKSRQEPRIYFVTTFKTQLFTGCYVTNGPFVLVSLIFPFPIIRATAHCTAVLPFLLLVSKVKALHFHANDVLSMQILTDIIAASSARTSSLVKNTQTQG
ncbi:hypothetical protein Ahy_B08g094233 isoform C [Arachis hypogaea]|uniref:Uncharacterized protein n=1 Tax=Arachis hypogaea TaxID=3818 RepID=A0A444Y889_ARAHY|nr:hypothetical protein Ahy_B08g094233 isoform C [Arachis hypogaea]